VCKSDLALYTGRTMPLRDPSGDDASDDRLEYPCTFGHEPVGIVEQVHPSVRGFSVGERVAGAGWVTRERSHSTHVVLDESFTVRVPGQVESKYALAEPLGAAVNIVRSCPLTFGDRVAVIGCGFMGLTVLALLRGRGLREIVAVDRRQDRLDLAAEMGATATTTGDSAAELADVYARGWPGVDVAIDLSGSIKGLMIALKLVRKPRATIAISSMYPPDQCFTVADWLLIKSPILVAAHPDYSLDFRADMELGLWAVVTGVIPIARLVNRTFSLCDVGVAHETALRDDSAYIKGVVLPADGAHSSAAGGSR
jgi:threonine dehydrogenase-like Zn-dependent dehydrogenase